jgi:preprotein translocase SecE subunit
MSSVTKNDEKTMATDVTASGSGEPDDRKPTPPQRLAPPSEGGFFHITKRGQGYWTRMGTAGVAVMLIALIGVNIAIIMEGQFKVDRKISIGVAAGVSVALALLAWRLMNKPSNVDFLVATDSEMKKVNWTSRKDLFGATKVVIIFMFLIALILLLIDIVFGYFFQLISVLKFGPFG